MSKELRIKDETLINEAVIAYRDQFSLTPSRGFRRDICVTIQTYADLCLWAQIIGSWGYINKQTGKWKPRNPLDVRGMLTIFEMTKRHQDEQREREQLAAAKVQQSVRRVHRKEGVSGWPSGRMPQLLERPIRKHG